MTIEQPDELNRLFSRHKYERVSLAHLLCDRHDLNRIALYYENESGEKRSYTYGELSELSKKFATVLKSNGVEQGDRVAILLPKGPELLVAALAIWRLGAVYLPLFTAFGPQAISYRVDHSGAEVIITDEENRFKLVGSEDDPHQIDGSKVTVITVQETNKTVNNSSDIHFWDALHD